MAYSGSMLATSIHGTWIESIELTSIDDGTPLDLTSLTEVTLKLRDLYTRHDELTLTMSNGDIVSPADGILQWRAEVAAMGTLVPKLYEMLLILEDASDDVPVVIGTISIVE